MKHGSNKRRKIAWGIGVPVLVLVLLLIVCTIYLETYYRADTDAIEASFPAKRGISEQTLDNGDMIFSRPRAKVGLIFYPGGKVEHTAYVPLMRELAASGVNCVLCRMPFRLAVFDLHAADAARDACPDVERWYIGGHSLGGVIAASELKAHPGVYEGLILLGSYATEDLSAEPIRALSIYGSEDRVLNLKKYDQSRGNLPNDLTEFIIDGGCHAQFGMYGAQDGDGTPAITNEEQIRITATEILNWLNGGAYAENS